ncbi:hypothetical protein [Aquimarina sp. AU474]|uniref:hypothetical protein n=1 Tax=Aquimarina sp. AU474 TaxID=2108529 RepID=UPI000D6911ED|nr:hypothetical protein [Aquimarina sp. AU474]
MNKLVYIIVTLLVIFSCKSNSLAQEKFSKKEKPDIENPKGEKLKTDMSSDSAIVNDTMIIGGGLQQDNVLEPGAMHIMGSVIAFYKSTNICDRPYKAALKIRIEKILKSGSGIVNVLSSGQEITLGFISGVYTKDLSALQSEMKLGKNLSIMVKEGLCPNLGNDTVYEIMRFSTK